MSILGTRVVRVEDPRLLTAGGIYTEDRRRRAADGRAARDLRPLARGPRPDPRRSTRSRRWPRRACVAVFTAADLPACPAGRRCCRSSTRPMAQPLLATDGRGYVGEPVAVVLTEDRYQGEDAAELVDGRLRPAAGRGRPARRRAADEVLLFPERRHQRRVHVRPTRSSTRTFFDGCEVVVTPRDRQPARRRRAAGGRGRGRGLGRGRPAASLWCPEPGRAGHQGGAAPGQLGLDADAGPRDHARRRRRVRGQVRRRSRASRVVAAAPGTSGVRCAGSRPARRTWSAMTHGRGQVQTVTIGGDRDGTDAGLPAGRPAGLRRLPADRRAACPALTTLMAPGVYDIAEVESRSRSASSPTPRRSGPTAAPAGPRPPPRSSGPWTCSPPRSAWTRPRCAAATCCRRSPSRTPPRRGAVYDIGDYPAALDRALQAAGYDELRRRAGDAPARARRRRRSSASGCAVYVEITGGGAKPGASERERHRRGPPRRHRRRSSPAPRRTARATRRSWAMLASEELGIPIEKITVK